MTQPFFEEACARGLTVEIMMQEWRDDQAQKAKDKREAKEAQKGRDNRQRERQDYSKKARGDTGAFRKPW